MSTIESFSPFKIHPNLIFSFDIHRIIVQEQLRHTNSSVQFLQSFAKKKRKKILSSQYFIFPLPSKLSMCKFSLLFQPNITKKKKPLSYIISYPYLHRKTCVKAFIDENIPECLLYFSVFSYMLFVLTYQAS